MLEIDFPSIDPMQHKSKAFLGMTIRQIVLIVPALIIGALVFVKLKSVSMDLAIILTAVACIPAVLFGWYEPYNMKFEQYLSLMYKNEFVNSKKRIYKTDSGKVKKLEEKYYTIDEKGKKVIREDKGALK